VHSGPYGERIQLAALGIVLEGISHLQSVALRRRFQTYR
jgi:hypothetical protein